MVFIMKRIIQIVGLMVLLITVAASGEPRRISLDEAVRMALKENYALKSSRYDLSARRWGLRNAVTQFLPRVTFSTVFSRVDEITFRNQNAPIEFVRQLDPSIDIPLIPRNSYSSDVTITQPIYNGGSLWANLSVARNRRNASKHVHTESRLNTILETKQAYFDVLRAEDMLDIWETSADLSERYYTKAQRKKSLGMASDAEVLRWQLQHAEDNANLIQAENNVALAHAAFNRAVGADPLAEFELDRISEDEIMRGVDDMRPQLEAALDRITDRWSTEALTNSPALKSMRSATAVSRALYRQTYSLFQPSLNFSYSYMWETDDDLRLDGLETWRANVVLSFPIFSSFGDYASLREARDDLKSSEASEVDFEKTILLQVVSMASKLRAALKQVDAAKINRELARENAQLVEAKFEQGMIDNLNLIDARVARTTSESRFVSAIYSFLIAQAELDKLLGRELY